MEVKLTVIYFRSNLNTLHEHCKTFTKSDFKVIVDIPKTFY